MECLNFEKRDNHFTFVSLDHGSFKARPGIIMHWLPAGETIAVDVLMPDGSVLQGVGERNLDSVRVGQVVQFERFGFCRLEQAAGGGKAVRFIYCHR